MKSESNVTSSPGDLQCSVDEEATQALRSALEKLTTHTAAALREQLSDQLSYERQVGRLWQGVLTKLDMMGGFIGGPTREEVASIQSDAVENFMLLAMTARELGHSDTPDSPDAESAGRGDAVRVASAWLVALVADPTTSLGDALEAAMVLELAASRSWRSLVQLVTELKSPELTASFLSAEEAEQEHIVRLNAWLGAWEASR